MIARFPSIAALSPEASTLAMLMIGFAGFGLAMFSVGIRRQCRDYAGAGRGSE